MTSFPSLFPPNDQCRTFRDPSQLIGWLHAPAQDAEAKNEVLSHLLRASGGRDRAGDLAVELLLLALWPGLCVVRRRLWPLCRCGTLDADLLSTLTIGIRRVRLGRITRVAATLLRNLERDLRRLYIRDDQAARLSVDMDKVEHVLVEREVDRPDVILSAAQAALGEDGALLVAVHIAGFTQKEAADQLGISHEAARKRCQRALSRLREQNDP
ncbi:sigma factor-like helix-turn-helix DNA-binding protein [Roseovarius sp. Pro17]|uniref:sigma factor-like helix-turn-helix DNA-binding protein n=1 Tax=Roseovarius sp. Pro17 TaxID=3108175 RepID=UPI002D78ADCB|nr:sigma factor-like helix-turn-helix DNA-binding protein [Roseovarius sp. Pro17]